MRFLFFLSTVLLLAACGNTDRKANTIAAGGTFLDYRVRAEEGRDEVAVVLRFRQGSEEGEAIPLSEPATVEFDGKLLAADSAARGGAFYETVLPASGFAGTHRIRYTDAKGTVYEEGFNYWPFSLAQELPERLPKKPFIIRLASFPEQPTTVQLVLTDTSFASPDVNEDVLVEKGELRITEKHLVALSNGPVTLEIYRDEERPLKPAGQLILSYALRRQFELLP